MGNDTHVIATFDDASKADQAADQLLRQGLQSDQISLLVTSAGRGHHFQVTDDQTKAAEGVGYGAVLGGLAAGLAAAAVPGSLFVAGPAAALLASGATGAATGGLLGGFIGMGFAENEVKLAEEDLGGGDIMIAVHNIDSETADEVRSTLKEEAKRVH